MNQKLSIVALALAAALFLAVNLLAAPALRGARIDLTEQKLYTLSEGTRNIVRGLDEPVTLRLYFSKGLVEDNPSLVAYAERVQEMLEEYVDASEGNVDLEVIDPEPFSEDEDRAVSFGVQGEPVNAAGDRFYFGIVGTNTVDGVEVLPALDPRREAFLEYEVTEMVDRLSRVELPVVGVLSAFPLRGGPGNPQLGQPQRQEPWVVLELLQRRYEVRHLDAATLEEIPEEVSILLLVHPKGLGPKGLYAIDQYCLAGGKVVAFLDAFAELDPDRRGQNAAAAFDAQLGSDLGPLMERWGVHLKPSHVAGDSELCLSVQSRTGQPVPFPPFVEIGEDQLADGDVLTAELTRMRFLLPGAIELADPAPEGLTIEVLATTSEEGGGTLDTVQLLPEPDPERIHDTFVPDDGAIPLAVRISGTLETAFPDGPPSDAEEDVDEVEDGEADEAAGEDNDGGADDGEAEPAGLATSSAPFNAIVVADADMINESLWGRASRDLFGNTRWVPVADNAAFLVSALENLAGSNDLIALRSRAEYRRPFTRKRELAEAAQEEFRAEQEELEAELRETERQLSELQQQKDPTEALVLSEEQEEKLAEFREKELETRRELRRVRQKLRADIDRLGTWLKFFNTLLVPLLIGVSALFWWIGRSAERGRKRS